MIAIAKIGGHQVLVRAGEQIEVDKISAEVGKKVEFEALLISDESGENCEIGTPFLGKKISAKVLSHDRSEKIRVFKMHPRKRYRRTLGHRQDFTKIEILDFASASAKPEKAAPKSAEKEKAKKPAAKKVAAKSTAAKK